MLIQRVIRAIKLEAAFFKEAVADAKLTNEAMLVVIIAAVAIALGNFLAYLILPFSNFGVAIGALFIFGIFYLLGFAVFVFLVPLIGNKLFQGKAMTWQEALRPLGYAQAPNILAILALIPAIGWLPAWIGSIWALVITVFAVKETQELDWVKAGVTCFLAWIAIAVLNVIAGSILGAIYASAVWIY